MPLPELDRAALRRRDIDFLEARLADGNTWLVPVHRGLQPMRGDDIVLIDMRHGADLLDAQGELVWLGMLGERACFAIDISAMSAPLGHPALVGAELADLRLAAARLTPADMDVAFYARALLEWHKRHAFCGTCGERTKPRDGGHVRVCTRAACGIEHFPRTDPCVLVLVTDPSGERCVLGRQAAWPTGMYSTLAGFVEPGETIEQAVVREVLEEVGLRARDVRYVSSQPWPFPASLMLAFVATTTDTELRLDDELQDARWATRDELRSMTRGLASTSSPDGIFVPGKGSISGKLLDDFANGTLALRDS